MNTEVEEFLYWSSSEWISKGGCNKLHTFSDLKQHIFIVLQLWGSEVPSGGQKFEMGFIR